MYTLIGAGLFATAGLLLFFTFVANRHPETPKWISGEGATVAFALLTTASFSMSVTYVGLGLDRTTWEQYAIAGASALVWSVLLLLCLRIIRKAWREEGHPNDTDNVLPFDPTRSDSPKGPAPTRLAA